MSKKPLSKQPAFYIVLFVLLQLGLLIFVVSLRAQNPNKCPSAAGEQTINVTADGFVPKEVTVPVCTKIVFANQDERPHLPAFGEHDHHLDPAGFYEELLAKKGQTNTFVISAPGTLEFHDHLDDDFTGSLTVTP